MSAANKALVQRYLEMLNTQNFALVDELIAPNVSCRFFGFAEVNGLEAFKQLAPNFAAFPDGRFTVETIIAEADPVAIHWRLRGTHQGEYLGIAATGKQVTETGTTFYRIAGGKISELWGDENALGLLQQLRNWGTFLNYWNNSAERERQKNLEEKKLQQYHLGREESSAAQRGAV